MPRVLPPGHSSETQRRRQCGQEIARLRRARQLKLTAPRPPPAAYMRWSVNQAAEQAAVLTTIVAALRR
jgi:hypothetical protein